MEERDYWLGFSNCRGIGPMRFRALLDYFGTAQNAWKATESELHESGIGKELARSIIEHRKTFSSDAYNEKLQKLGVDFVTLRDDSYPHLLSKIKNPPFGLYVKGNGEILKQATSDKYLAVVGTRRVTDYGRQVTELLTGELVARGFVIVSGLALGVDAIAHATTVAKGGKTIAVLGCGVDCCYPGENLWLYKRILEGNGTIISEYPLGTSPSRGSFPARNRIVAGLSRGVLVTEGAADSGALITAADSVSNGRPVFAVPNPITSPMSKGTNTLIQKGAKVVTTASDILEELQVTSVKSIKDTPSISGATAEEQQIIDLLSGQDMHFDTLVKKTGFDPAKIGTVLSLMEMKGMVRSFTGGVFALVLNG